MKLYELINFPFLIKLAWTRFLVSCNQKKANLTQLITEPPTPKLYSLSSHNSYILLITYCVLDILNTLSHEQAHPSFEIDIIFCIS